MFQMGTTIAGRLLQTAVYTAMKSDDPEDDSRAYLLNYKDGGKAQNRSLHTFSNLKP